MAPIPSGPGPLYYALAAVGIFSLLVGASVRLRRPDHQATLHFFWLCIAFFGVLAFSFSGRLDTLDRVFYWGDVVSMLMLPPLFLHFALMFPERPDAWARSDAGRPLLPLLYLPALLLGAARVASMLRMGAEGDVLTNVLALVERGELLVFRRQPGRRALDHDARAEARALGDVAPPAALDRLGHCARRLALLTRLRAAVRAEPVEPAAGARQRMDGGAASGSCPWPSPRRSCATA